ncbi:hypothetical protein TcCL_Unassigned01659 [Trypanosoma cruzi]|nr:hypothetical protein TcCL_Unassigned01659 [Trypanosoma cruzi]
MLQCSLMLLVYSVLATAAFCGNEKERCTESAPRLSSPVEMLHGVWRYCPEMPNHHARGRGTEWKIFFVSAAVGVDAAASDLSARWSQRVIVTLFSRDMLRRFQLCVASGEMCRRLCDCRVEGEAWREVRERRGQESRWASRRRGHCPPNAAPLLSGIPCHFAASYSTPAARSEAADTATATGATGGNTSAVAFRGGHTVWHSGVPTTFSRIPHTTPGSGRGVSACGRGCTEFSFHLYVCAC